MDPMQMRASLLAIKEATHGIYAGPKLSIFDIFAESRIHSGHHLAIKLWL